MELAWHQTIPATLHALNPGRPPLQILDMLLKAVINPLIQPIPFFPLFCLYIKYTTFNTNKSSTILQIFSHCHRTLVTIRKEKYRKRKKTLDKTKGTRYIADRLQ